MPAYAVIFSFDEYELDVHDWRLRRSGQEVHIQRKAFEVLRYLIEHRDRPVSRQELLEHVWSGDAVTPAVLTVAVSKARQAIGQSSSEGGRIQTEHGRGYRFVGELRALPRRTDDRAPSPPSIPPPAATPFVGRDAVMGELQAALTTAIAGRAQLRLLEGEPGVGKTRAAEELATLAAEQGIEAFWGRSHERSGMPAFWPWLNILRHCIELVGEQRVAAKLGDWGVHLQRLLPRFAAGAPAPAAPDELESGQFRVYDAVTRLLLLAAETSPLLLILDDLHWGDESSIELLGYMLPEIASARVLIIGTLRDTELPRRDRNRMALDFLSRHPSCRRVRIDRLTAADVERYTEGVLGHAAPELSSVVFSRTEGNAYFMTEALRTVATAPDDTDIARLPDAALDIVRRRLVALGSETEQVLSAAAVIGRTFDLALLAVVTGRSVEGLREQLQVPLDHGLIVTLPEPDRFAFGHGLTRRTLYDDLALADRARLHLATAEALDQRLEGGAEVAEGRVADHYLRALPHDRLERAIELAIRSAQGLENQFAHTAAATQYARALRALERAERADPEARLSLLLSIGRARRMAGQLSAAREAHQQALVLARRSQRPTDLARAAIGLRACQPMRAVPEPAVHDALSEALMVLPDDEVALRARVLARLSGQRTLENRLLMSQRAAVLAEGIEDAATRCDVLLARLHATQTPDTFAERLELADQLIALAEANRQPQWSWDALLARYDVALRRGDMEAARQALDACAQLAESLSSPPLKLEVARLQLQHRVCDGDSSEEAEREMYRLAGEGRRLEAPFAELHFLAQIATVHRDRGIVENYAAAGRYILEHFPWAARNARSHVAMLCAEAGETQYARELYETYTRDDTATPVRDEDFVYVTANLLQCAVLLGDDEQCAQLYERLLPYAEHNVANSTLLYYGSAHYSLGRGAAALGRVQAAREHFERAIEHNRAMGNRGFLARSLAALAELEAGEGHTGRADGLYDEALAITRDGLAGVTKLVLQSRERTR